MTSDVSRAKFAKAVPWTLAGVWAALLLSGLLQYLMPAGYQPPFGVNQPGIDHYRETLGIQSWTPLDPFEFLIAFRCLLGIAFLGYLRLLYVASRSDFKVSPRLAGLAWIYVVVHALTVPASLSCDVYGYLAYARMVNIHHLNPYYHTQFELAELNDPVAPFLQWDVVTPYGPFWTLLSIGLIAPVKSAPLFLQLVLFKLLAAAG